MSNDFIKAVRFEFPEMIPVSISFLPAAWMRYGAELQELIDNYPQFFNNTKVDYQNLSYGDTYHKGSHVDEWGCVWENVDEGMESIVKGHPVSCEEDVFSLKIPENRDGRFPHGFMYLRLLDLCGFELGMELFGEEGEAIDVLIGKVLEYNRRQMEVLLPHIGQVAYFGDDLGMQSGLAIGAERWRKYMKPCYSALYGMIKKAKPDTLVYMHTDGCIYEIMPDLVDCGVDMINPQFRANGLDNLVRVCRSEHRIAINLDLDRQLFPFAAPSELDSHVAECVEALYLPEGGLGLNIEFNYEVPLGNMAAVLDAVDKYRRYSR
jgi:uroporphyrinogen decarboxylase